MRNEEKFKTVEERTKEFKKFCSNRRCSTCSYKGASHLVCSMYWLADEYGEPKPDLPFKVSQSSWLFTEQYNLKDNARDITIYSFAKRSIADKICDQLNAAALAWHERMCKKEKGESKC